RIRMITITVSSSMSVKPRRSRNGSNLWNDKARGFTRGPLSVAANKMRFRMKPEFLSRCFASRRPRLAAPAAADRDGRRAGSGGLFKSIDDERERFGNLDRSIRIEFAEEEVCLRGAGDARQGRARNACIGDDLRIHPAK